MYQFKLAIFRTVSFVSMGHVMHWLMVILEIYLLFFPIISILVGKCNLKKMILDSKNGGERESLPYLRIRFSFRFRRVSPTRRQELIPRAGSDPI